MVTETEKARYLRFARSGRAVTAVNEDGVVGVVTTYRLEPKTGVLILVGHEKGSPKKTWESRDPVSVS